MADFSLNLRLSKAIKTLKNSLILFLFDVFSLFSWGVPLNKWSVRHKNLKPDLTIKNFSWTFNAETTRKSFSRPWEILLDFLSNFFLIFFSNFLAIDKNVKCPKKGRLSYFKSRQRWGKNISANEFPQTKREFSFSVIVWYLKFNWIYDEN